MNRYIISVIIPIYNVEKYLEETIKSIINQDIGFQNIELILVNDGSVDGSEKICLKYKELYPNNVKYIKQENSGVSTARNNGLKIATGKYINFLDGDDKWSSDALKEGCAMLDKNNNVDVVAFRVKIFDKINKNHYLNDKFDSKRIIDIKKEYKKIQTTTATTIIRTSKAKKYLFDKNLKYGEDGKYINDLIFDSMKYAIINKGYYYYRRRKDDSSAVNNEYTDEKYFSNTPVLFYEHFISKCLEEHKKVDKYYQYLILNDIRFALKTNNLLSIPVKVKDEYIKKIHSILKYIDNDIINELVKNVEQKNIIFRLKYDTKELSLIDNNITYNNEKLFKISELNNNIEIFEKKKDYLLIEGNIIKVCDYNLYYKINNEDYIKVNTFKRYDQYVDFDKNIIQDFVGYQLKISLKHLKNIKFYIGDDKKKIQINLNFTSFSRLNNLKENHYYDKGYIFYHDTKKIYIKHKFSKITNFTKEIKYLFNLVFKYHKVKVAFVRFIYFVTKPFFNKNIWLISDREFMARDSGELLFRYIMKNHKNRNVYFVINKGTEDYLKLTKLGKTLNYHTFKYNLFFLHSKLIISSHFDNYVTNAFGGSRKFYSDLYKFSYAYLTHGILLHDSSKLLNKYNKNIKFNVATSNMEFKSITKDKYYYFDNEVKLTGLPRYDNLYKVGKPENKILFMPSWRSNIAGSVINGTQTRMYNPKFKESEYYKFYNKLLNDERLLKKCREKKYKIKFCVHPSFRSQFVDFIPNDVVTYAIDVDSQYETKSSKFLVTDYSSAACDFAYIRRPVVYANFDYEEIFKSHYYNKGYFDYDKNGFGPNCKDYEETLRQIIKYIDNDGKLEKKYEKRINEFFAYNDNHNCERVYNELIKM